MKAVKAEVTSSNPISLSKASATLSLFAASETGAQPDVSAYLRRAVAAFEELVSVHREIRHQRKISQFEQKDVDDSHRKKKGKETDCEPDIHGGNSLLEQQRLEQSLGSAPVDANGVVQGKKVIGKEKEKRVRVGDATESDGVVENKTMGKKERKKKLSKDEMKSEKVEAPRRVSGESKKRKHSDAKNARIGGQTEQHLGKKRRR
ncbi:hypothetical protein KSP39_PZI012059 [Platanthera zijinensis]|uniref:Uncharacterized protein n=1 Tax=Platanthera zijinensis TaxID=2320716 RepID=A0AAP0BF52_9ASPA